MTAHSPLTYIVGALACVALAWVLARLFPRGPKKPSEPTKDMKKILRRVSKIPTQDLYVYLEQATTAAFDAVHAWTRASDPKDQYHLRDEAILAVSAQLALLEEQKFRSEDIG